MRRGCLALLLTVSLVAVANASCREGAGVIYVNETDVTVEVFRGDGDEVFIVALAPQSSSQLAVEKVLWDDVVTVKDAAGRTLLRKDLTWEELEAQDFRIVIRPEDIEP